MKKVQAELAAIDAAHNPDTERRLLGEAASHGFRIKKAGKRKNGYTLISQSDGTVMEGLTLADIDRIFRRSG